MTDHGCSCPQLAVLAPACALKEKGNSAGNPDDSNKSCRIIQTKRKEGITVHFSTGSQQICPVPISPRGPLNLSICEQMCIHSLLSSYQSIAKQLQPLLLSNHPKVLYHLVWMRRIGGVHVFSCCRIPVNAQCFPGEAACTCRREVMRSVECARLILAAGQTPDKNRVCGEEAAPSALGPFWKSQTSLRSRGLDRAVDGGVSRAHSV